MNRNPTPSCPNALLLPAIKADTDLGAVREILDPIEACLRDNQSPVYDSGSFRKVDASSLQRPARTRPNGVIRGPIIRGR